MQQRNRLFTWLNLHPGEGRVVFLLTLLSFSIGWTTVLVDAAALALFLSQVGADALPETYIIAAGFVILSGLSFGWLSARMRIGKLIASLLLILTLTLLAFRLGMGWGEWIYFALLIWYRIIYILAPVIIGSITSQVLHLRQTKRLFGLIGNGENMARVLGYGLVPLLAVTIGVANILLLALVGLVGAVGAMILLGRIRRELFVATPTLTAAPLRQPVGFRALFLQPYTLLIIALIAFGYLGYSTLDLVFSIQVQQQFSDAESVAAFLGRIFFVISVFRLLGRQFLSGRLFERYGLRIVLMIQPLLLILSAVFVIAGTFGNNPLLVFWLVALMRLFDSTSTSVVSRPAIQILYQALPASQRVGLQSAADGVIAPLALGLAGAIGMLLRDASVTVFAGLLFGIGLLWALTAQRTGRAYLAALERMISRRGRFSDGIDISDPAAAALVRRALTSPRSGEVLYALELLRQRQTSAIEAARAVLLAHPAPEVRLATLELIQNRQLVGDREEIARLIAYDHDPAIRAAAIRALCAVGGADAMPLVTPLLSDPDPQIGESVLTGLLRDGGAEGRRYAQERLDALLHADDPDLRAQAATIIRATGDSAFVGQLRRLLNDSSRRVRRAALIAAGHLGDHALLPELIAALNKQRTANAAATGIEALGAAGIPALREALAAATPQLRVRLANVLSRIGGADVVALLRSLVAESDSDLRTQVYHGLLNNGYRAVGADQAVVRAQIRVEAERCTWLLATEALTSSTVPSLLTDALQTEVERSRERILTLLALLTNPQSITDVRRSLAQGTAERRSYALEIIDLLLPVDLKPAVMPLFDDILPAERMQRLKTIFPQPATTPAERLAYLIEHPQAPVSHWTRQCAIYAASALRALPDDANQAATERTLAILERVKALHGTQLFATTPGDILADLAPRLKEHRLAPETTVFAHGDFGDAMYIVVEGEVRIHIGTQILNVVQPGQVFGEMAILDPAPRAASATTTSVTRLISLDRNALDTLLDERPEIARSLIRSLNRNLRSSLNDLAVLRSQLAAQQQIAATAV